MKSLQPFGPLLQKALFSLADKDTSEAMVSLETKINGTFVSGNLALPVILKLPTLKPRVQESWEEYKARVQEHLEPTRKRVGLMTDDFKPLITANSIQAKLSAEQIKMLATDTMVEKMELDPLVQVVLMDDVKIDVALPAFQLRHPGNTGKGVSVAVLDTGIDLFHPFLQVSASSTTSDESINIPGSHGTHCAGSIASKDQIFPGIAPGVTLLNVKVLRSNGQGTHTNIVDGIDAALDLKAEVLSLSLGFNHLPTWSNKGHGWLCANGHCPLCTAIDNAVSLDGVVAVVAAGNEHERAEALRATGQGNTFDTELCCPGQAKEAITVAALTKTTFQPASFSSMGPTSNGMLKPDIAAPGVNVMSTLPIPRDSRGQPLPNPARADMFGRKSGTSMATPIVAGAVALIVEKLKENGITVTPASVKNELFFNGMFGFPFHPTIAGRGRLALNNL